MKRSIFCILFIICLLLSIAPGNAGAEIVTHSLSGAITWYTPVDPHTPVIISDPQVIHLFDVTFDTSETSHDVYDIETNTMGTEDIDDFRVFFPDAVFLSNASFTFSEDFPDVFPLLGIDVDVPGEGTLVSSYVSGIHNGSYPSDPMSYSYGFFSDSISITFMTDYRNQYSESWLSGYGKVYDSFSFVDGKFDFGNNAVYGEIQFIDITQPAQTPIPGALWLFGSSIFGIIGYKKFRK